MKLSMDYPQIKSLRKNNSGAAAFLITLVLILVISLIVLGFSQLARRDQRNSLENQLSSQAFYAAETGVNLVRELMRNYSIEDLKKDECISSDYLYKDKQLKNDETQVYNSCLLVDSAPSSLVYDNVGSDSVVVPLKPAEDGYGMGTLTIEWAAKSPQSTDSVASCPSYSQYGTFPVRGDLNWPLNCPVGVLRFDLVDVSAAGSTLDSEGLLNKTMTVFAPPTTTVRQPIAKKQGSVGFNPNNVVCSSANNRCSLKVSGINFSNINYLRLTSLYKDVTITDISGQTNDGRTARFVGAQVAIDSTGRAVDVVRRFQVRLKSDNQLSPSYSIQATDGICKLYFTEGTSASTLDSSLCPL